MAKQLNLFFGTVDVLSLSKTWEPKRLSGSLCNGGPRDPWWSAPRARATRVDLALQGADAIASLQGVTAFVDVLGHMCSVTSGLGGHHVSVGESNLAGPSGTRNDVTPRSLRIAGISSTPSCATCSFRLWMRDNSLPDRGWYKGSNRKPRQPTCCQYAPLRKNALMAQASLLLAPLWELCIPRIATAGLFRAALCARLLRPQEIH